MDRGLFIDVAALERNPFLFETALRPASLRLSDERTPVRTLETAGRADLLDREGRRWIRVRGRIRAAVEPACDRCLERYRQEFDQEFELYFCPMETIAQGGESALGPDEIDIGFYEGDGVALADVVREQLLLWLPMRSLCDPACRGLCPTCGANRNAAACACRETFADPRWDGLRHLQYKH